MVLAPSLHGFLAALQECYSQGWAIVSMLAAAGVISGKTCADTGGLLRSRRARARQTAGLDRRAAAPRGVHGGVVHGRCAGGGGRWAPCMHHRNAAMQAAFRPARRRSRLLRCTI